MPLLKRIVTSSAFQETVATVGAGYLRLVGSTTRHIIEPANVYDTAQLPVIIGLWHGQHFIAPFIKRKNDTLRAKVLISRHRDGEINARAAEKLGIGTIRGSGAHNNEFNRKGGVSAFSEMLEALKDGYNVALTLYQIWPVDAGGHAGALVWRGDLISANSLGELHGIERLALLPPHHRELRLRHPFGEVPADLLDPQVHAAGRMLEQVEDDVPPALAAGGQDFLDPGNRDRASD